jgi:hypothetical protein
MDKADPAVSSQYAIDFLARSLMRKDEQVFKWLLESLAAQELRERADAEINLHPPHSTLN